MLRTHTIKGVIQGTLLCVGVWTCQFMAPRIAWGQGEVNQQVSPDLFGETVDIVTPGYLHWSKASGDTVDPHADRNDLDNNFGEHAGAVDIPSFSSQSQAYAQGSVAEEFVYAYGNNTVRWRFKVPGAGYYVIAARLWREHQQRAAAVFSYRAGDKWIELPAVENIQHWGDYGNLVCFLIRVPAGAATVPIRVSAPSGRCLIYRVLLGKKREGSPFIAGAKPPHPSLYFRAADLPVLREKIKAGPPQWAWDYMVRQVSWYTNTLSRGDKSWQRGSEHHVPRSIAQTAFVAALTESPQYTAAVLRMVATVMGWQRQPDVTSDQRAGFNLLERARELSAMAMAYDWLYDQIPEQERHRLRRFLDEEANRLYLYNETGVGCRESGNWDPWIGAGYGMVGIALRDEHRWARNWVDSAKRTFRLNLLKSHEDFGYFNNGFVKALDFAASLYTATGEDLFTPEGNRLRALLDYRMMLLEPQRVGYPQFGDASGSNDPILALCCAAFLRDPLAQWCVNHLSCADAEQVKTWGWNHMMPIAVVALYERALEEQAPGEPRLPLARSFVNDPDLPPGLRAVTILRTGYDRPGDIQLAFRCADYAGWHGHPDQGSFVLNAYQDHLVIDRAMGAPYGAPASDFSKSSLAHSVVLIDGEGQVPYSAPVFYDKAAGQTSPLLHTEHLDYVRADSTMAYRKNPRLRAMDHAHRHFLFVRKPGHHAYVVIIDDLQQDHRLHDYAWLLQTDTEHTIESKGSNHQAIVGKAELHLFTVEPNRVEVERSEMHGIWRTLRLNSAEASQRGLFFNVLYPRPREMPLPEVKRLAGDGFVGATVAVADGNDLFLFATAQKPFSGGGVSTDGQIAAVGRKGGKVAWFLCVGGTRLEVDGQPLFQSDQPVTTSFNAAREGCIVGEEATTVALSVGTGQSVVLKHGGGATVVKQGGQ